MSVIIGLIGFKIIFFYFNIELIFFFIFVCFSKGWIMVGLVIRNSFLIINEIDRGKFIVICKVIVFKIYVIFVFIVIIFIIVLEMFFNFLKFRLLLFLNNIIVIVRDIIELNVLGLSVFFGFVSLKIGFISKFMMVMIIIDGYFILFVNYWLKMFSVKNNIIVSIMGNFNDILNIFFIFNLIYIFNIDLYY